MFPLFNDAINRSTSPERLIVPNVLSDFIRPIPSWTERQLYLQQTQHWKQRNNDVKDGVELEKGRDRLGRNVNGLSNTKDG